MSEKRFEEDCDENVCSFDYSTLDTYYEYNVSNEEIIEWNKHSSNAQYTDLERITEILNIKQMRLESLMKHREEIGKLFGRIDEQQSTIRRLQDLCGKSDGENAKLRIENKQLRQMIKENVFGRYRKGSFADLEFKAIAYDDIVKLEMSNESEPKVIVVCKQGKKENVKSFCQMFIPYGIYYEITEVIE